MTQETDQITVDSVRAFEDLRAEISLMRRAIEGLTAARERILDYTPTLKTMDDRLTAIAGALVRIEKAPAIALTPIDLTKQITASAFQARAEDARKIDDAREAMARSVGRIDGIVERGQSVEGQMRRLAWCCVASAVAAIILWNLVVRAITG